ncbi:universal stress protein UspA [Alkaliphilus pronyensis]|uniref:Universal stress protein UspA n=1 Tax=Alkaliphilus pronyensis TaxID=1482732 RepID=A0A6I0F5J3_9FIRM|nr:universal stress protein UspA [Alkaliphilus pronyensis]KAB3531632.1 universal stress protein UspA [Alkaliphilus pronyensis]
MKNKKNVMVCVTQQVTCERLIKIGADYRGKDLGNLYVVHVAPEGVNFLGNSKEGEALDYLFEISKEVDADMTVLRSSNVVKSIVDFCQKNNIGRIILGESLETSSENSVITKLSKKLCKNVDITVIPT